MVGASSPGLAMPMDQGPARSLFGMETEPVSGPLTSKWRSVELEIGHVESALADCRAQRACPEPTRDLLNLIAQGAARTGRARFGLITKGRPRTLAKYGRCDKVNQPNRQPARVITQPRPSEPARGAHQEGKRRSPWRPRTVKAGIHRPSTRGLAYLYSVRIRPRVNADQPGAYRAIRGVNRSCGSFHEDASRSGCAARRFSFGSSAA